MLFVAFPLLLLIFAVCVWASFVWFICVLGVLPWVYSVGDSLVFLDSGAYFLPHNRGVFSYYLFEYFLTPFLFVFFWNTYDLSVETFNIVPEVSDVVLISFISFFLSAPVIFTILFSASFILSSVSVILLLILSRVLLISVIALFIIDWLFFISSRSLLNISCILSILVSIYL